MFFHRDRLAGDHRFIDAGFSVNDLAVDPVDTHAVAGESLDRKGRASRSEAQRAISRDEAARVVAQARASAAVTGFRLPRASMITKSLPSPCIFVNSIPQPFYAKSLRATIPVWRKKCKKMLNS